MSVALATSGMDADYNVVVRAGQDSLIRFQPQRLAGSSVSVWRVQDIGGRGFYRRVYGLSGEGVLAEAEVTIEYAGGLPWISFPILGAQTAVMVLPGRSGRRLRHHLGELFSDGLDPWLDRSFIVLAGGS